MDAHRQLSACASAAGLLASPDDEHNYRRVWSRDGIISALGALAGGVPEALDWLERTLRTLAVHQGPVGQVPSNVTVSSSGANGDGAVSFGTAAVRVDATTWFIVGVGVLARAAPERVDGPLLTAASRGRPFLRAWEGNERGLLTIPRAGNWADEYPVLGATLYDNALRVWAEREANALAGSRPEAAQASLVVEERPLEAAIDEALLGDALTQAARSRGRALVSGSIRSADLAARWPHSSTLLATALRCSTSLGQPRGRVPRVCRRQQRRGVGHAAHGVVGGRRAAVGRPARGGGTAAAAWCCVPEMTSPYAARRLGGGGPRPTSRFAARDRARDEEAGAAPQAVELNRRVRHGVTAGSRSGRRFARRCGQRRKVALARRLRSP